MRFILASSSPRRREILSQMIPEFEIIKPDVDESRQAGERATDYVQRLARAKAQAVVDQLDDPQATVLAADTIVVFEGEILGKPANAAQARRVLQRLCHRSHDVYTAFTVQRGTYRHTDLVRTIVHMRDYRADEIEAYIATGDPFDKAGSYAIQHVGFHPVERIEGSHSNVVGLPAAAVRHALTISGVRLSDVPFHIRPIDHQLLEFIPSDTPLIDSLDPAIPMTFCMVYLTVGAQRDILLHYNPNREQWELAAGGIEVGEHPDQTAARELFEESSQICDHLRCRGVMKLYPMRRGVYEYAAVYSGHIDHLAPFTPNEETSELRLWQFNSPLEKPLGKIGYEVMSLLYNADN